MAASVSFDSLDEPVVISPQPRRKRGQETNRQKEKKARHSGGGKIPSIACNHDVSGVCKGVLLTPEDITHLHSTLYENNDKVKQDAALLARMKIRNADRARVSDDRRQKKKGLTIDYTVNRKDSVVKIQVCKKTFCSIFTVSEDRVLRIAQYWAVSGNPRPENRGGKRINREVDAKKDQIKAHIQQFTCRASHYARKDNPGRKYLPSDLSVAKMYRLFGEQNHAQVTYGLYYSVFMYNFNLAFGHPATDMCSTCGGYNLSVKNQNLPIEQRQEAAAMHILHRRKARMFYSLLQAKGQDPSVVTICFDMMENQVLPKVPINQAYYSRQMYLYILGIVRHRSSGQKKEDVFLATWLECENKKDSNMVASAVSHVLINELKEECMATEELNLFSDSCFGQNKNINVVSSMFALRKQSYPTLTINHFFPERGHSFLPADRAFGRIEQELRKHDVLLTPNDYYSILRNHGTLLIYGQDWHSKDVKAKTAEMVKSAKSFKISEARQLTVRSDKLEVKTSYNGEGTTHTLLKRGKTWTMFNPELLPTVNSVSQAKGKDVRNLLNLMKVTDDIMELYNGFLANTTEQGSDEE